MTERINILCTPDDNYIPYCGIMLTSLFENNKHEKIVVYIIDGGLKENNKNSIVLLSKKYNQEVVYITINKDLFNNCPIRKGDHVSIAAYYRIIAPDILPANIDKILYLDCDITINRNITDLYKTDIAKMAIGAVIDEEYFNSEKHTRLQIPNNKSYINSGVILFNLEYWRKNKIAERCLQYVAKNAERVILHDQDTLNAVLHDKIEYLPLTYNFQTGFLFTQYTYEENVKKEIEGYMYNPAVIHFTGYSKPWHIHSQHPYRKRFLHYQAISLWKDTPIIDHENLCDKLRYWIINLVWVLRIKKRPKSYIIEKQP